VLDRPLENRARLAVAAAARDDFGRLLAALIKDLRDFQLAEDSLQDALESALTHWSRDGLPDSPSGWLLKSARRKAIDRIRRSRNFERLAAEYVYLIETDQATAEPLADVAIPDERLSLIFTCCHPALDVKTRVALTLRTLCGLTTPEIARAFLDSEDAIAQRLVRARQKISKAGIPYQVPEPAQWPERLNSVLAVVYLVFNEGYAATAGRHQQRFELCVEAIRLGRMLLVLRPAEAEVEGLLSLMLLSDARRAARVSSSGELVPLETQIAEGTALLESALDRRQVGVYQFQAAISAVHAEAENYGKTRWQEIVLLYDGLYALSANPVNLLNRAIALSYMSGAEAGLAAMAPLQTELGMYQPFYAARADLFRRAGRDSEAREAYAVAIELSKVASERAFLIARVNSMFTT
jgi:RNA polymerase sigma-70 factor (ECF subfamily)